MDEVSLSSVVRLFQMTAADTAHALVPIIFIVRRADSFMVSQMQMKKKTLRETQTLRAGCM